jgi:hypothetical protein
MIIAALPRCGATKYCLDLQEKTGLKFIGELNPIYLDDYHDTAKQTYHETGFQPLYSNDVFVDALINPDKHIILINQSPHLRIHDADIVLLRKNMKDAFISQANFFIKSRPYLKGEAILQHLYLSFQSFYGVATYLNKHQKSNVVWYEDYFKMSGTKTDSLDDHPHRKIIYNHIDKMFDIGSIENIFENVKEKYNGNH